MNALSNQYIIEIKQILTQAKQQAYVAINATMVQAYWQIGERIVQEEQNGKARAEYGKEVLKNLSIELTKSFGKGFSTRTLWEIRQFYLLFPDYPKMRTAFAQLSWSHFQRTLKLSNADARHYYLSEAAENGWSVRTLDRNISSLYYERLLASPNKTAVQQEMRTQTAPLQAEQIFKNPTILEFLNLPTSLAYTEKELEKALIDNLQQFMLELGKGFAFVARQQHIRTETSDFFIDLVFYNYILKCFVLVELKTEKLTHQAIGQLDMYVRMYDDLKKQADDNPTIGLLLCTEKDNMVAKYSVLNDNKQLFASQYQHYLPTEQQLIEQIAEQKWQFEQQFKDDEI